MYIKEYVHEGIMFGAFSWKLSLFLKNLFNLFHTGNFSLTGDLTELLNQWFPNGVSGGTTRCVAKLKNNF
jgi:hypothetical protein